MDYLAQLEKELQTEEWLHDFESVDAAQLRFDEGLHKAILQDEDAFSMIVSSMEFMRTSGEFTRVQQMAMVLGATACTHQHMQEMSQQTSSLFTDVLQSNHGSKHAHDDHHDHDHDDDDDTDSKKKKKKAKKGWVWFK
jgi:hypothetical protein